MAKVSHQKGGNQQGHLSQRGLGPLDFQLPTVDPFRDYTHKDAAMQFVKYITSPEGQARLATSSCYWGMPANMKAGDVLTPDQKAVLRWDQQPDYLARAQLYPVPSAELDTKMQDLWTEMLQQ